jgi:DASS family divalent anion:Na+ symporter
MNKRISLDSKGQKNLRILLALLGIIIGVTVAFSPPPPGMSVAGMRALGILFWAITWWIFNILPEYITAMLMTAFFVAFKLVPTATAFASFVSSTWWILLAALGLGTGMSKSGLLTRMALVTLRLFPKSFKGQILGLLGVGTITGPFLPSITAKAVILAPFAMAMSDALGYQRKGQEASALFAAMFTGIRNVAPVFISASVIGYLLHGMYPPAIQAQFSMGYWFFCALPWGIVISILNYFTIVTMYKPKNKLPLDTAFLTQKIDALGPMTTKERIMLVIITLTVIAWATEPLHGLAPHVVGIIALCITLASGVYDRTDFRASITWDSLIFIGMVMNLSTVFQALNINNWIVSLLGPTMLVLVANPYLLVIGLALITVLVRFIIISELAYVSIFMAFLIPVAVQAGINPWVVGMVIYCMENPWLVLYQNPTYLAAQYATQGEMAEHKEMARFCITYLINSLIALLISVPFWQYLHLLP